MKVGLVSFHSFANPGGVKSHITGLSEEFTKRGIENKILVPRRKLFENYGSNVIILGTSIPVNIAGTQGDICFNFNPFAIDKVLKREKFDVLHFHNFIVPSGWQILDKSKSVNILTFHANLDALSGFVKNFYLSNKFFEDIGKKMDGIIGVAPLNLEPFKNCDTPKAIIPNGINLKDFAPNMPKIKKFADNKKINILFLGRIEERKGLIFLLQAYKILKPKYKNIRLIIVGDGTLKKDCINYTKKNRLKEVYFEGKKPGIAAARKYYATCDIYCSPAIFGESFGIVLLEAMACGKPVCGFKNLGYGQLLKGTMGERFLAEPENVEDLASKLEILIRNEKLRQDLAQWGIEEVKKYDWKNVADQVLNFYEICKKSKKEN
ncbi:MAG: glycosyltransferase family 4 protein [Candidatus Pacebacteria bacterium]|nr:glycosyltransferase family 4 protein [Candidatus Paceibacterota bacterium]